MFWHKLFFIMSISLCAVGCTSTPPKKTYLFGLSTPTCQSQTIKIPQKNYKNEYHTVMLSFKEGIKKSYVAHSSSDIYAENALMCLKSQQFEQKNFDKKRIYTTFYVYDLNVAQQEELLNNNQELHSDKHIYKSFSVDIKEIPYIPSKKYPRRARRKDIQQGSVTLSFDINKQGKAKNIKVLHSTSKHFIRNAKKLVKRGIFDASVLDGLPESKTFRAQQTIKYKSK